MSFLLLVAQAAAAALPEAAAAPQQGVISYPPSFFAAQQPNTALEMLNRIPGFSLDTGASVRGFEGAAGNVLIDGQRPSSKSDNLNDILNRVPASKVERIDLIRGGAPGIDMQGKTVLANIITKKDSGFRGLLLAKNFRTDDGRDFGGLRADASGTLGQTKWEVSANVGRGLNDGAGRGLGTRIFRDGSPTEYTAIDGEGDGLQWTATGAAETPLFGGALRVNGRIFTDSYKEEETVRILGTPRREANLYVQDVTEKELGARYSRKFGPDTDLEAVGLYTIRDRRFFNIFTDTSASRFDQDRHTTETIGRAVFKHRFDARLSVEAGGETAINKLDSLSTVFDAGGTVPIPAGDVQVQEDRSEVFAKSSWRPMPQWTVDAALRYEFSTISSDGDVVLEKSLKFLKPRLAVTWAPNATFQLRGRIEREVGQLNFGDFVASGSLNSAGGVTAGNPDLDPENSWVYELAVEQRFWKAGSVVLTYRHLDISDVIDRGPVISASGVFDTPKNIGDGARDVLIFDYTLPLDRLGLKGAQIKGQWSRRWSSVTDPTTLETRRVSGLHHQDWNATFTWDMPAHRITWGVDAFGDFEETYYRYNLVEVFNLHTYVRPFLEWKPTPEWNVRFELPNVTRRNLRDTFYVYPGLRSLGGIPNVDDRNITHTAGGYSVRVRKTFG